MYSVDVRTRFAFLKLKLARKKNVSCKIDGRYDEKVSVFVLLHGVSDIITYNERNVFLFCKN